MNRHLLFAFTGTLALLAAAAGTGCSGNENGPTDAGQTDADIDPFVAPVVRVTGTAEVHPAAREWLESQSQDVPSLEGLTLSVEEPLRAALGDEAGVFGTVTLEEDGAFSVDGVDTARVNTHVAAAVRDERMTPVLEVVPTSTSLWDVQSQQGKPELDIDGVRAWALPTAFHEQLTVSIGAAAIEAATGDATLITLIDAGFLLGRVVDAEGNPVAGAVIASDAEVEGRIWYPNETFTGAGTGVGTSAHGLFVYVHPGTAEPSRFTFTVKDRPEYLPRNGVASVNAGMLVSVFPAGQAPSP